MVHLLRTRSPIDLAVTPRELLLSSLPTTRRTFSNPVASIAKPYVVSSVPNDHNAEWCDENAGKVTCTRQQTLVAITSLQLSCT